MLVFCFTQYISSINDARKNWISKVHVKMIDVVVFVEIVCKEDVWAYGRLDYLQQN